MAAASLIAGDDPLCCQEEDPFAMWTEEEEEEGALQGGAWASAPESGEADRYWDREGDGGDEEGVELAALLSKEAAEARGAAEVYLDADPSLCQVRLDAVGWLLKACARHAFTTQTALLAVAYLDRFLSSARCGGAAGAQQQPWMAQLSAVACLSLAAKMEETHVPLLLDLQMEEARYVFEARTVQRMELLVLSTLGWRMGNPTPLSFIDHFLRRKSSATDGFGPPLYPKSHSESDAPCIVNKSSRQQRRDHCHLQGKFQARCHSVLLAAVADSRWLRFHPSVLAAAAMLRSGDQILCHPSDASSAMNLQSSLVELLNVTQDNVRRCAEFILDATGDGGNNGGGGHGGTVGGTKRKRPDVLPSPASPPSTPRGVADAMFSYDSYDHCLPPAPGSTSASVSSSPVIPPPAVFKRARSSSAPVGGDDDKDKDPSCHRPLRDAVFV